MVKLEASALPLNLVQGLSEMGYTKCGDVFIRFCFARMLHRADVLSEIAQLSPESLSNYSSTSDIDLERSCSPLASMAHQNYFLISIRQEYALNLFDRQQSAQDMFGGNPNLLLRWSNVYYSSGELPQDDRGSRADTMVRKQGPEENCRHIPSGRSDNRHSQGALPQVYEGYGTLDWKALYEMCRHDIVQEASCF